ncbi:Conidiation-specific protein 10 [Klebsiella pneumoniae subsp. pneumoniae 1084]|nr:Conidiation-specific protein 10 [Klebsiella pneumoniae subsp. pneumoniae 1084]
MAVPATLPKTVKEHQKQDVKVASIAGGSFKNDPQRASEAGKKGGKNSHGSRES